MWNYLLEKCEILDLLGVVGIPPAFPPFHSFDDGERKILEDLGKNMAPFNLPFYVVGMVYSKKKVFKVKKSWTRNFFLSVQREQDREIGREMKAYAASVQALDCIGFDPMFDLRTLLGLQHGKSSNSNDKYKLLISVSPFVIIISGSILVSGKSRLS